MPNVAAGLSVSSWMTGSSAAIDVSIQKRCASFDMRQRGSKCMRHASPCSLIDVTMGIAGHKVVAAPVLEGMAQRRHVHRGEADDAVVAHLGGASGLDREIGRRAASEIVEERGDGVEIERLQRFDFPPADAAAVEDFPPD